MSLKLPIFLQSERASRSWLKMLMRAAVDPPRREFRTIIDDINFAAGMRVRASNTTFLQVRVLYYQGISNAFDNISVMKVRNRSLGLEVAILFPVARI